MPCKKIYKIQGIKLKLHKSKLHKLKLETNSFLMSLRDRVIGENMPKTYVRHI